MKGDRLIQTCKNCHTQFNWGQIYKSFWLGYKPITCAVCDSKHKITIAGRFTFVSSTLLPMMIYGYSFSFASNIFVHILIGLLIFIAGSLVTPKLVTYRMSD
ncbi:TIGR04104 family putative zinc finger protein [Salinibacillus xinjiangensis]|uniref:CXXC-20-CXXC protein n=1 Tax=Salinibacillus xinjiangensis TaxID=1229268 RepID=A0A6G1X4N0_9BACI|nr:hypothetical protein [Salinibacillus xinjiangensis]